MEGEGLVLPASGRMCSRDTAWWSSISALPPMQLATLTSNRPWHTVDDSCDLHTHIHMPAIQNVKTDKDM